MEKLRKPFQGVINIVRFNWHYYVLALSLIIIAVVLRKYMNDTWSLVTTIAVIAAVFSIFISLIISSYIYDFSSLYKLSWLNTLQHVHGKVLNIHAGFDETSHLLQQKFPSADLAVADFYDAAKHTEVSIKRARKVYPAFPGTQHVSTKHLPVENNSLNNIFLILSAHEIRQPEERVAFFKELRRSLVPSGQIIVTEHLRDLPNFLAYNIGFFHFHSRLTWLKTFSRAGLNVSKEIKITPFISTFVLEKNGTAS
jgi:SAM-dependent methyltransferase